MKNHENNLEISFKNANPVAALWVLYKGHRGWLLAGMVFVLIKHLPFLYAPVVTAKIINILIDTHKRDLRPLWINAAIFLALILENVPMHTLANVFLSKAARAMEATVRGELIRRMQQLSIGFHDLFQSGRLQSKVLADVEALMGLSGQFTGSVYMGVLNIVFALAMTISREPLIALFYLATVPLAIVLMQIFRSRMKKRTREYRRQIESMSARISEMVDMIPITRAHGVEETEISAMDLRLQDVRSAGFRLDILNALFGSSTWVTMQAFQLVCLVTTGLMAYHGSIPVGDVVMYNGFFAIIINSVNMFLNMYPQITRGGEAVSSIGEVLAAPDIEKNQGKLAVARVTGAFAFEKVSYTYPSAKTPAIDDVSFTIREGECVAFVGGSGAGKSTILNLIIGFRRPVRGRILLDGADMETLDLRTYRKSLAVVTQQTILFSGAIRDNITYGQGKVDDRKVQEAIDMANAAEFISRFPGGLKTIIGEGGKTLSGGQMQRVAIARALIRDPRVIILDEATSSLDVISEFQVQQAIERLIKGRTTFIVAHRLSTIRIADRIVVMKNGRCEEMGTHDELLAKKGEFFHLWSLQK
jgi:ATP-binding cassette subfamily B protein